MIESLARWGKEWVPGKLSEDNADPDLIVWDMHRRMALESLPDERTVIQFEFIDQPDSQRLRWLVGDRGGMDVCIVDPGYEVDLFVMTDSHTIVLVWYGDLPVVRAIDEGSIRLHGPAGLCRAFPQWLDLSPVAGIPRKRTRARDL